MAFDNISKKYDTPAIYTVLEKSLIGNEMFDAGANASYDGMPSENLAPTDDVGRQRYQDYLDSNAVRIKAMNAANPDSQVGDPALFAAALAKELATQNANVADQVTAGIKAGIKELIAEGVLTVAKPAEQPLG